VIKPQYVDQIPKVVQGQREVSQLSGGELQRFSIAVVCVQQADMYMFDELSSYLEGGALPRLHVSYKPQKIAPKSECTVRELLPRQRSPAASSRHE